MSVITETHINKLDENKIVKQYEPMAYKLIKKYIGRCEADDLLQTARVGIMEAVRTHNPNKSSLKTHIYNRISFALQHHVRNDTGIIHIPYEVDRGKSAKNAPVRVDDFGFNVSGSIDEFNNVENSIYTESLLKLLPKLERDILYLIYNEELSHNEIAEQLNINPRSIAYLKNKAINRLRLYLNIK